MLKRFISYYKPFKKVFFLDMFCALIVALSGVVFPVLIRFLTLEVFHYEDHLRLFHTVLWVCAGLLLLYLVRGLCQYYVTAWGHIMGARIEYDMRHELFAHMEKLSFSFYDKNTTGHMVSRILSDLFDITELAHHGPENLLLSSVKLLGSFVVLLYINVPVSLVLLSVTVLMIIYTIRMNKEMRRTFMNNRKRVADINAVAQDSLSGIRTVVSFNHEEQEIAKFNANNERFYLSKKENYLVMGRYHSVNGFFQGLLYLSVLISGSYAVVQGNMLPTDIIIYILYINMFLDPIRVLIDFTEQLQRGYTGFMRMCEIMDTEPEIKDKANAITAGRLAGDIRFDHVKFAYDNDLPVLDNLDLTIKARTTVALVGPSGAGKTTFCSLIPRFYEVSSGSLLIDGVDVSDYSLNSLRQNIGMVQQDVYIFNMTVRENIAYGKADASFAEIVAAAQRANIHDFIMSLPDGYETHCGEHGVRFSGGQKQRISIARVFLQNPPILILDEATSALDNQSEVLIQQALEELAKERTTIVIAHRLSTIKDADEIIVLTAEGVKERGRHKELLAQNGLYKTLYDLQFTDLEV